MATYYLDFENGNDANAGTSFATRWKTITSGATAARIAPGDEIRMMASPAPVDTGVNATWTNMAFTTITRPFSSITTASNTTPIRVTTSSSHGLVTGDTVYVNAVNVNLRANGTWTVTVISSSQVDLYNADGTASTPTAAGTSGTMAKINGLTVTLASPVTQNIALCGNRNTKGDWVASANVTQTQNISDFQEGSSSQSLAIAAGFTTGKAAYFTLPSTLDLSGFQQVCFWVSITSGIVGADGQTYVALCSDTTGDTVVHQCPIPNLGGTFAWTPIVIDFGAALSTTINSVAFYVVTDSGAQTFLLDNIFAAKASSNADALRLTSLISKNTTGETWFVCKSINATRVVLGAANGASLAADSNNGVRGYNGTTATQTLFRRETVPVLSTSTVNDSGTAGSFITFSGGWNRTDMSTQTDYTWIDGRRANTPGVTNNGNSYIRIQRLNLVRYSLAYTSFGSVGLSTPIYAEISDFTVVGSQVGINVIAPTFTYSNFTINSCGGNSGNVGGVLFFSTGMLGVVFDTGKIVNCSTGFVTTSSSGNYYGRNITGKNLTVENCYSSGALVDDSVYTNLQANNNVNGFGLYDNVRVYGGAITGASTRQAFSPSVFTTTGYLYDFTNSTGGIFFGGFSSGSNPVLYSNRQGNTDNNHFVYATYGTINFQTAVTDSPAIGSWRFAVTSANAAYVPLSLKLGTVVCAAGSAVTVTARMRRSNTNLTMRLVCPGGQQPGVSTTVTSSMTAAADTWETVSISFTPTSAGGLDIYAEAFGGTTHLGYVCNMTATQ
jgi:hypothetical protein